MSNVLNGEEPDKLTGDPFELLSSLAFEPMAPAVPPPPPTADTVSSSVMCTGSWEIPFAESTSDEESAIKSADTLEEAPSRSREESEIPDDETGNSSSRGSIMNSKPPRRSRFSVLGAVSVASSLSRRTPREKSSRDSSIASERSGPPTRTSLDGLADLDDSDEFVLPGAEAVSRESTIVRPPIRKASSIPSSVPERPVRVSMTGTEMFNDLESELVEAKPVKTEEELKTEIKIDTAKKYEGNARISTLLVAEEIDLESAEYTEKQRRIKDIKGSWRWMKFVSICCLVFLFIMVVTLISNLSENEGSIPVNAILATENPTAAPTFSEIVTPFMCEEAAPLDGNSSQAGSTRGAPTPGDLPVCSGLASNGYGTWFEFVGDGNVFNCTTCHPATNFDTQLSVFAGSCSKLQCVAANDQARSGSCDSQSKVEFSTNPGETYRIFVHGKREAEGQVVLSLNPVPQDNDSCQAAGSVLPSGLNEIIGNTWFAATNKNADNFTCSESTVPGLWYAMEGADEDITVSTCSDTSKYDADISVAVGGSCDGLTCVSTTNEDCIAPFRGSIKTFFGTAGTTYYVKIHGSEAARASVLRSRQLQDGASPADGQFGMVTRDDVGAGGFFVDKQEACEASKEIEIDGDTETGILYQTSNLLWDSFCEGDGQGEYLRVMGNGLNLTASTCNDDTAIDTTLALMTGNCSNEEMTCIASNDQFCGDQSSVTWFAEEGVTYYLLVRSVGAIQGKYAVSVSSVVDIIDPVQQCESARQRDVLGSSIAATLIGGEPFRYEPELTGSCGTSSYENSPATWFKLDETEAGTKSLVSADYCYTTAPLELTVFSGSCDDLICVAGSSDFCNENVEWDWEDGLSYYLMFHGPESIGATFDFNVDSVIS
ncbi:MAG: hypothetical protein SGBAC_002203 [Bacillariaceae sp.]